MDDKNILEKVKRINLLAQSLIKKNKALEENLLRINNELNTTILKLQQREEQIKNFENQLKIAKLAKGIVKDEEEKKALRLKINAVIREVDKCLAYLQD